MKTVIENIRITMSGHNHYFKPFKTGKIILGKTAHELSVTDYQFNSFDNQTTVTLVGAKLFPENLRKKK